MVTLLKVAGLDTDWIQLLFNFIPVIVRQVYIGSESFFIKQIQNN